MKKQSTNVVGISTEQAINAVLKAENDTQQKIIQCEAEAEHVLEQARQTVRRIGERTNQRITRIHQRSGGKITEEINRMKHASEQLIEDGQADQFDIATMSEVMDQIALSLTTAHVLQKKERE